MRVLFVTHNVPRFDGDVAGSFVLRLAVALQTHGVRVEILAPGAAGLAPTGTLHGVTIHRVRYAEDADMTLAYDGTMVEQVRGTWKGKVALVNLLRALRRAARAQVKNALAAGDPFDVVHTHWWFPAGLALWRALPNTTQRSSRSAPARVLTMHGSDVRLAEQVAPSHALFRAVLSEQTVCTAVSSWLATTARSMAAGHEVRVEPMPVDARRFVPPSADGPDAGAREGILFVGRLNAQKGIADLIAAMSEPSLQSATLHVVGEGPDRDAVLRLAQQRGCDARITWSGNLAPDALLRCYQRARVVAMPSRNEGLGLVAVEAQLCGTPVVAYDSGGVVDVVRPEAGGTLIPVGDISALAAALREPLDSTALGAERGALARESMLAHFSTDAVGRRYLAVYHDAIRARSTVAST